MKFYALVSVLALILTGCAHKKIEEKRVGYLLLESGDFMLTDNGNKILLDGTVDGIENIDAVKDFDKGK